MCSISDSYNPKDGPITQVLVFPLTKGSISGTLIPTTDPAASSEEFLNKRYNALIDTGATVTCISDKVIRERLPSSPASGMTYLRGVKGINEPPSVVSVPVYSVAIVFLLDGPPHTRLQNVQAPMIASIEKAENLVVDVIIGMDLISEGSLSIDSNHFSLRFPRSN